MNEKLMTTIKQKINQNWKCLQVPLLECAKFSIDALPFSEHLQISVDNKLFVHENHLNFLKPIFSRVRVTRSLVSYVSFVDRCLSFCTFFFGRCLSFCTFFFGRCVVCSSIYRFWLLLNYLCTTELPQNFKASF